MNIAEDYLKKLAELLNWMMDINSKGGITRYNVSSIKDEYEKKYLEIERLLVKSMYELEMPDEFYVHQFALLDASYREFMSAVEKVRAK